MKARHLWIRSLLQTFDELPIIVFFALIPVFVHHVFRELNYRDVNTGIYAMLSTIEEYILKTYSLLIYSLLITSSQVTHCARNHKDYMVGIMTIEKSQHKSDRVTYRFTTRPLHLQCVLLSQPCVRFSI